MFRLVVVPLIALAGCSLPSDKTVLRVWQWNSPVEGPRMREYLGVLEETFEREHPGVDLQYQYIPYGPQYVQKILASMAAGRPPDCIQLSIDWANDLYERGVLADLRPYADQTPEMADEVWLPSALESGRDGDYIYGMPFTQDSVSIVYNVDLFEEAGISTDPFAFETWEDFRQAAIKMTKRDERGRMTQAGFMFSASDLERFLPWLYANGVTFYSPNRDRSAFGTPAMLEVLGFLQKLGCNDKVSFPTTTERQDLQLFLQGKVAMFVGGTYFGRTIEQEAPGFRFGMASLPSGPHGKGRSTLTWTNPMGIPRGAKHPDLGWEYVKHVCGLRNGLWRLKALNGISPLAAFYKTPEWEAALQEHPWFRIVPHLAEVGGPMPVVRYTEIDAVFKPLLDGLMLNTRRPEEVLSEAQTKVDIILGRYYSELQESYR